MNQINQNKAPIANKMTCVTDLVEQYKNALLNDVVPWWMKHSIDQEHGGYFTCLNQKGQVYDTDKFIWLQCREVWTFANLYNTVEKKQEWLDIAVNGAEFLKKYGRDEQGNWYFAINRKGQPLIQPYNIFSDCFATMAFGQLYKASGKEEYAEISVDTFRNVLKRKSNPKGKYNKQYSDTRPGRSFDLPMILSNLVLEIEDLLPSREVEETIQVCKHEVLDIFYKPELKVILEHVNLDGTFQDSFNGRLVNPGHGLEAMWFIMSLSQREDDKSTTKRAVDISMDLLEFGWDKQYGGIFYFLDLKGHPTQQLEWDQKLWWVHQEAILATLKGYLYTGDERCWNWFEKLHDYTWSRFPDSQNGEWFGYLNRRGEVLLNLKGGKWKGCFHTPRFLKEGWKTLELINKKKQAEYE